MFGWTQMEGSPSSMNIAWVASAGFVLDPTVDIEQVKHIGPVWGSWQTWRANGTDNVICYDHSRAQQLISQDFHRRCNFYIAKSAYQFLDRPTGIKLFDGEFQHELDNKEDIISMHLASGQNDIVLLLGFDFSKRTKSDDRLFEHRLQNYRNLARQVIQDNAQVQWVLLDHANELASEFEKLDNLSQDSLKNALAMLDQS